MTARDDGGPAFPTDDFNDLMGIRLPSYKRAGGMSLRDYFAGQFLTAIHINGAVDPAVVAEHCYRMADAMLAERAK